jgi:hypothetical protein
VTIESVDHRSRGNDFRRGTRTPCLESLSRHPCEPREDIAHREPHGRERHVGPGPGDGGPPRRPRLPREPRMGRTVQPTLPAGQVALSNWTTRPVQSDRTDSPNLVNDRRPIRGPSDSQSRPGAPGLCCRRLAAGCHPRQREAELRGGAYPRRPLVRVEILRWASLIYGIIRFTQRCGVRT